MDSQLAGLPGAAESSGDACCSIPGYLHPTLLFKLKGCGQTELALRLS